MRKKEDKKNGNGKKSTKLPEVTVVAKRGRNKTQKSRDKTMGSMADSMTDKPKIPRVTAKSSRDKRYSEGTKKGKWGRRTTDTKTGTSKMRNLKTHETLYFPSSVSSRNVKRDYSSSFRNSKVSKSRKAAPIEKLGSRKKRKMNYYK